MTVEDFLHLVKCRKTNSIKKRGADRAPQVSSSSETEVKSARIAPKFEDFTTDSELVSPTKRLEICDNHQIGGTVHPADTQWPDSNITYGRTNDMRSAQIQDPTAIKSRPYSYGRETFMGQDFEFEGDLTGTSDQPSSTGLRDMRGKLIPSFPARPLRERWRLSQSEALNTPMSSLSFMSAVDAPASVPINSALAMPDDYDMLDESTSCFSNSAMPLHMPPQYVNPLETTRNHQSGAGLPMTAFGDAIVPRSRGASYRDSSFGFNSIRHAHSLLSWSPEQP